MDLQNGLHYQVSRDGQQFGPYDANQLMQMAQAGQVVATDQLWADGMAGWEAASSFSQLAAILTPPAAAGQSTMVMQSTPVQAPSSDTTTVQTAVSSTGALQVNRPGVQAGNVRKANIQTSSSSSSLLQTSSYSGPTRPGANFGLIVTGFLVTLVGTIAAIFFFMTALVTTGMGVDESGEISDAAAGAGAAQGLLALGAYGIAIVGGIVLSIFTYIYLYRAWNYIQDLPNVATTPGKAVGFLFIPFFNIYWLFVAYHGWSKNYNMRNDIANPNNYASRASEGLFLTFCILTLIGLGVFIFLPVMSKMCKAINELAAAPPLEIDPNAGYSL